MAVDAELVDADGLVLERVVGAAVFGQQLLERPDGLGQLVARHHGAGPAVADPGGAPQRHIRVTADVERHRFGRGRAHLQPVEIVELAVELHHPPGQHQLDDLDHLVDALATLGVGHPAPLEFLRRPADPDTEAEPVAGQVGHRADLTRQQQRIARAQLHHVGVEADLRRHGAHRAGEDERIDPRGVLVPHPGTVRGVRIVGRLLLHVEDGVGQRDVVEPEFLGGLGDLQQIVERAHRHADGVLHAGHDLAGLSLPTTHIE